MKLSLLLISVLFSSFIFANAGRVPQGWWSCTFFGNEWEMVPGPNGVPEYELQPRLYSSEWNPSQDAAYDEALNNCKDWSDTDCSFESCRQK